MIIEIRTSNWTALDSEDRRLIRGLTAKMPLGAGDLTPDGWTEVEA